MRGIDVRKIRKKHKLTQKEFGEAIGYSKETISIWERNNEELSSSHVRIINDFILNNKIDIASNSYDGLKDDGSISIKEPTEEYLSKIKLENKRLLEENLKLAKELIDCKNEIIKLLINKS